MEYFGNGTYMCIFIISFGTSVITALTVSSGFLWLSYVSCVISGFSLGMSTGGVDNGIIPSILFSLVFIVAIIPGCRITKRNREKAIKKQKDWDERH